MCTSSFDAPSICKEKQNSARMSTSGRSGRRGEKLPHFFMRESVKWTKKDIELALLVEARSRKLTWFRQRDQLRYGPLAADGQLSSFWPLEGNGECQRKIADSNQGEKL
jgi:hypothetical protein